MWMGLSFGCCSVLVFIHVREMQSDFIIPSVSVQFLILK
jgi:hypothetical protein